MSEPLKILVVADSGVSDDLLEAALPLHSEIHVLGIVEGLEDSWAAVQESQSELLVVACSGYSDRALFFIEGAVKQQPARPVVVLAESAPNGFLRRVFEAGADDIVALPESPETVRFTLKKALARKQGATSARALAAAPMICVLGPKGGTGKTVTSANLAVGLAAAGKRVALVDLDLQFGDVGLALGMEPDTTIYDLVRSAGSLDADKLDAYLTGHSSGARVLLAPSRPDQASAVSAEFLRDLYRTLRSSHDFVVVDTPPGFTPEVITSIDSSSHVCMVGMLDSLSLKNTKLGLETLELMGYEGDRIRLLLNRADSRVGITSADVTTVLGRQPEILVPSDREIPRAVNEGVPIILAKPDSEAARAFRRLAAMYLREDATAVGGAAANGRRRGRLLARRS
jgi:pilus assembly protein CpaE